MSTGWEKLGKRLNSLKESLHFSEPKKINGDSKDLEAITIIACPLSVSPAVYYHFSL